MACRLGEAHIASFKILPCWPPQCVLCLFPCAHQHSMVFFVTATLRTHLCRLDRHHVGMHLLLIVIHQPLLPGSSCAWQVRQVYSAAGLTHSRLHPQHLLLSCAVLQLFLQALWACRWTRRAVACLSRSVPELTAVSFPTR